MLRDYLSSLLAAAVMVLVFGYFLLQNTVPEIVNLGRFLSLNQNICSITESRLATENSAGEGTRYSAAIQYTYQVQGKVFTGNKISFFETSGFPATSYEKLVATYPVGSRVNCFYSSRDPAFSILQASVSYVGLALSLMPAFFFYLGVRVFWGLCRDCWNQKP